MFAGVVSRFLTWPVERFAAQYQMQVWSPSKDFKEKPDMKFLEFMKEKIKTDGFRSLYYRFGSEILRTVPR